MLSSIVGIACFLLSWFVLKMVLLLFGFWRVEHLLEIGGYWVGYWLELFFLKSGMFVGLYSVHTGTRVLETRVPHGFHVEFLCTSGVSELWNLSFWNSICYWSRVFKTWDASFVHTFKTRQLTKLLEILCYLERAFAILP